MMKTITFSLRLSALALVAMSLTACDQFVFGGVTIDEENNPITQKKVPLSGAEIYYGTEAGQNPCPDRKSTRLNSSHANISYAVFCLKKKKKLHDCRIYVR